MPRVFYITSSDQKTASKINLLHHTIAQHKGSNETGAAPQTGFFPPLTAIFFEGILFKNHML